jgi:predicted Zn-ribbon and HTH transcriptional regulator
VKIQNDIINGVIRVVEASGVEHIKTVWWDLYAVYEKAHALRNYERFGISTPTSDDEENTTLEQPVYCRDCGFKMTDEYDLCSFAGGFTCFTCYEKFIRAVDGDREADELVEEWNASREGTIMPEKEYENE